MSDGVSQSSIDLRRHLLSQNAVEIVSAMQKAGLSDPVGLVVEMTDPFGKQLVYGILEARGLQQSEIAEQIALLSRNAIPTFTAVVSFEQAKRTLSLSSDTAEQNLTAARPPGSYWIVVIAGGGNSYSLVPLPLLSSDRN
ncbi:MAG: hypothetical protein RLZZ232_2955 [Planctomycetota bacterium]|jgi:hypothetical protein